MANQEHVDRLREGIEAWNRWREQYEDIRPDLNGADLNHGHLDWNRDLWDLRHLVI
jgi:hypothetical protein